MASRYPESRAGSRPGGTAGATTRAEAPAAATGSGSVRPDRGRTVTSMVTDLMQLAEVLLTEARSASSGVAARTIVEGDRQRAVLMAIRSGHALGEQDAPPAATLQVLSGRATLHAGEDSVRLEAGQLVEVPTVGHDIAADQDTVAVLTVSLDASEV